MASRKTLIEIGFPMVARLECRRSLLIFRHIGVV